MIRSTRFALLALALALPSLAAAAAHAAHIDSFDAGDFSLTIAGQGGYAQDTQIVPTGPSGALGGRRDLTLFNFGCRVSCGMTRLELQATGPGDDDDAVTLEALGGGSTAIFTYGEGGDLDEDFLSIPGTNAQWDRLTVTLDDLLGYFRFLVTLYSDSGAQYAQASGAVTGPSISNHTGPTSLDLPYADFLADNPAIDLADIDRIEFFVIDDTSPYEGGHPSSYSLASFGRAGHVVPEPASALLVGLGLLSMAAACRNTAGAMPRPEIREAPTSRPGRR